ncbi:hypothetical protein MRX96_044647 [Rhipicephalus microplus]
MLWLKEWGLFFALLAAGSTAGRPVGTLLDPPCEPWPTPSSAGRLHPYVTGPATSCCSGSLECQHQSCPNAAVVNTSKLLCKALHDIKVSWIVCIHRMHTPQLDLQELVCMFLGLHQKG